MMTTQLGRRHRPFPRGTLATILLVVALAAGTPASAGEWTIEFAPLLMDAWGHDQQVLTVGELTIDNETGNLIDTQTPVRIETNSGGAYRGRFQYGGGRWSWGIVYLWFNTSQDQVGRSVSAGGGPDLVVFETANRLYGSSGPNEVLFFNVLEDTDLAIWTMDLYAARRLTASPDDRGISLVLGLRIGDFDNDYRAVTGLEDAAGTRYDASSNYGAMVGPVTGLRAEARRGRHSFEAFFSQSVLLGEADLSIRTRDYLGSFSAEPAFVVDEMYARTQDVAIPISELRLEWSYQLTRSLALGLMADAATWWDVPVPPGVVPGGGPKLQENTIVFFGLGGSLRVTL